MNLSVAREDFSDLLYLANSIVERRNTMPILGNVRLSAEDGRLSLAATNLEVSIVGSIEATIKTPGTITVDARVLNDIVRELSPEQVSLSTAKGQRLEVESGKSRFKINTVSSEEFPSIAGTSLVSPSTVDASLLRDMVERTAYAVSTDETRYNMNGILVEKVGSTAGGDSLIRFVATDGHRLALMERPIPGLTIEKGVIVPRRGIVELLKVLQADGAVAQVEIREGFFTVSTDNTALGVRLVDGQFPDYQQVIPTGSKTTVTLGRQELFSAVKRVSLVSTDKNKAIRCHITDSALVVSSSSPEYGEATESLEISKTGEDVIIGFSARYLMELLTSISDCEQVSINLNGELGPGIFSSENCEGLKALVMPMRFE